MSSNEISRIRESWFKGSPHEKIGVTERYVVLGEARRWMIDQLGLGTGETLDVGSGHGFLTFELASMTTSHIVGLDFLHLPTVYSLNAVVVIVRSFTERFTGRIFERHCLLSKPCYHI